MRNVNEWRKRGGVNRLIALLLAMIGVMLVLIAIPWWKSFRYRSECIACEQAMDSAKDGLIIDYLSHYDAGTAEDAITTLDEVLPGREDICPSHGTVYLVRRDDGIFEPICGLHDSDLKRRVRLNASRAKMLLEEKLRAARKKKDPVTGDLKIELNGKTLVCKRVTEESDLRRGTSTTNGYDGIVALYGIAGEGDFTNTWVDDGELCYFVYADENEAAVWRSKNGWTGSAY